MMKNVLAMVLAGGRGKRMDILCHVRPKPILSFAGSFRVVDFSLSNCVHSGISNIVVLADYQRSLMAEYLKKWEMVNANTVNLDVLDPGKGSYCGTADAVYQNMDYLRNSDAEEVLILAGDHVYKMDYRDMVAFHREVRADVTVGVVTVPFEETYRFGTLKLDNESRVTDFVEKSPNSTSNLASMGIYVFNKELLMKRLAEDAAKRDSAHDFGYAILPGMVNRDRLFAYQNNGYWQDIGSRDAYYAANMELIGSEPSFTLDSNWHILGEEPSLALMQKTSHGTVKNSMVSPGCVILGYVENSVISPGVRVEEKAIVRDSILMPRVTIGYHSVVDHCIVDEDVDINRYCYIGFDTGLATSEPAITVIGKGVTVAHHTAIGRNCTIMPHVGISDFTGNIVHSGTTLAPQQEASYRKRN